MAGIPGAAPDTEPDTETTGEPALIRLLQQRLAPPEPPAEPPAHREFRDTIVAAAARAWQAAGAAGAAGRHVLSYLALAAERLWRHYARPAPRGAVLAAPAELARRRAQLALDCAAYFDAAAVRHRLRSEMKAPGGPSGVPKAARGHRLGLPVGHLLRLARPPAPAPRDRVGEELAELARLPEPELRGVAKWIAPDAPPRLPLPCAAVRAPCPPPRVAPARPVRPARPAARSQPELRDEPGPPRPPRLLSAPEIPLPRAAPDGVPSIPVAALDLRHLARRAATRVPADGQRLPPLLAALTRRSEDDARLRRLRELLRREERDPPPPPRRVPVVSAPPAVPRAPRRALALAVPLRSSGPLHCAAVELDADPCPGQALRELYAELRLPGERLRLEQEPLLQPPATELQLCRGAEPTEPPAVNTELIRAAPGGPAPPARLPWKQKGSWHRWWKNTFSFDDFLKFVATADTDYLHVVFGLRGAQREEPAAPEPKREQPAPVPPARAVRSAERFVPGLWKPGMSEWEAPAPRRLQERLERLWAVLHVSGREKLAMAVKYGCGVGCGGRLPAALRAWESAAGHIQERELLLARLEALEQSASDPDRFFRPGAGNRAAEARARRRLREALGRRDAAVAAALRRLRARHGDTVTFRGRPYRDKMRWDAVEMLYWLQQRRRAAALLPGMPAGESQRRRGRERERAGNGQ